MVADLIKLNKEAPVPAGSSVVQILGESNSFMVDESPLSGEPDPFLKNIDAPSRDRPTDFGPIMIYIGARINQGAALLTVTHVDNTARRHVL